MDRDAEEARQEEVLKKFKPWFPHLRDIPVPTEPMPVMTPREALLVVEAEVTCLYDGGSGYYCYGHAFGVLEKLVEAYERNQVVK